MGKKQKTSHEPHSPLFLMLVRHFALGKLSASEIQEFADCAVKSGSSAADLLKLQALGAHGESPQNCHRDISRWIFKNMCSPESTSIRTPVLVRELNGEKKMMEKDIPVNLPHAWIDQLSEHGFLETVMAPEAEIRKFWSKQLWKENPQFRQDTKYWKAIDFQAEAPIPLVLHGDAAPYSETDPTMAISMRCMVSNVSVQFSQLMLVNMPKNATEDWDRTWDPIWKELSESFKKLDLRQHHLWSVPGVGFWTVKLDLLHLMDLGISCHIFANLLCDILDTLPGSSLEARLKVLNPKISQIYEDLEIPTAERFPKLLRSNLMADTGYPTLKHIKGRTVRKFSPVAVRLATEYSDDSSTRSMHRKACVECLDKVYSMADEKKWVFSSKDFTVFEDAVQGTLSHYHFLAKDALKRKLLKYSITQKFHLFYHFGQQSKYLTPRCVWCYGPESYLAIVKAVTASCSRGTASYQVVGKVLQKFSLAFHLLLKGLLDFDTEKPED
ncbi:unnamed protein product [Symbiodinium sp. CCMP2592]|nr:unnamed protein product [Symbiodinium sp. CCMP2592]